MGAADDDTLQESYAMGLARSGANEKKYYADTSTLIVPTLLHSFDSYYSSYQYLSVGRSEALGLSGRYCQSHGRQFNSKTSSSMNCTCDVGYEGESCEINMGCSSVNDCSDNGRCIDFGVCLCDAGYSGADCSRFHLAHTIFSSGIGDRSTSCRNARGSPCRDEHTFAPIELHVNPHSVTDAAISSTNGILLSVDPGDDGDNGAATVLSWGSALYGATGHGLITDRPFSAPTPATALNNFLQSINTTAKHVVAAYHHSIIVTNSGQVICVGKSMCNADGSTALVPQVMQGTENAIIADVSCSENLCLFISKDRSTILSIGKDNTRGQLLRDTPPAELLPISSAQQQLLTSETFGKPVKIAVGDEHILILTDSGNVLGAGSNAHGQLGLGHTKDISTGLVLIDISGHALDIAAFGAASAIQYPSNWYVAGDNGGNKLLPSVVSGEEESTITYFTEFGCRADKLALGRDHTVFANEQGLFAVGSGADHGQVPTSNLSSSCGIQISSTRFDKVFAGEYVTFAIRTGPSDETGGFCVHGTVIANKTHPMPSCECLTGWTGDACNQFVCDCGDHGRCIGPNVCVCNIGWSGANCRTPVSSRASDLLVFGNNAQHGLGIGRDRFEETWIKETHSLNSSIFAADPIESVVSGSHHTIILTRNRLLYGLGASNRGQFGTGGPSHAYSIIAMTQFWPSYLGVDVHIKQIAAGYNSTYVLYSDGSILVSGANDRGQLGLGDSLDRFQPTPIASLGTEVKEINCHSEHCAVIMTDGQIRMFGANSCGQLGLGLHDPHVLNPTALSYQFGEKIKSIALGHQQTLFLTETGRVFGAGSNLQHSLGMAAERRYLYEPRKIPHLDEPIAIIPNFYTTAFMKSKSTGYWFVMGENSQGEAGLGHNEHISHPLRHEELIRGHIVPSRGITIIISYDGKLFATGSAISPQFTPILFSTSSSVFDISIGYDPSEAVDAAQSARVFMINGKFCDVQGDYVPSSDLCKCRTPGWISDTCGIPDCTSVNQCSGNGICIGYSTCECASGFHEVDCSKVQGATGDRFISNRFSGSYYRSDPASWSLTNDVSIFTDLMVSNMHEAVYHQWASRHVHHRLPRDFWSARWIGSFQAPTTGIYKFTIRGCEGFRMFINGVIIIDAWSTLDRTTLRDKRRSLGIRQVSNTYELQSGTTYVATVEYFQRDICQYRMIELYWENNDFPKTAMALSSPKIWREEEQFRRLHELFNNYLAYDNNLFTATTLDTLCNTNGFTCIIDDKGYRYVTEIRIQDNGLRNRIHRQLHSPVFSETLEVIDLSGNRIDGIQFPLDDTFDIDGKMSRLDLSGNPLEQSISFYDSARLSYLTTLNLSNSRLCGIPGFIDFFDRSSVYALDNTRVFCTELFSRPDCIPISVRAIEPAVATRFFERALFSIIIDDDGLSIDCFDDLNDIDHLGLLLSGEGIEEKRIDDPEERVHLPTPEFQGKIDFVLYEQEFRDQDINTINPGLFWRLNSTLSQSLFTSQSLVSLPYITHVTMTDIFPPFDGHSDTIDVSIKTNPDVRYFTDSNILCGTLLENVTASMTGIDEHGTVNCRFTINSNTNQYVPIVLYHHSKRDASQMELLSNNTLIINMLDFELDPPSAPMNREAILTIIDPETRDPISFDEELLRNNTFELRDSSGAIVIPCAITLDNTLECKKPIQDDNTSPNIIITELKLYISSRPISQGTNLMLHRQSSISLQPRITTQRKADIRVHFDAELLTQDVLEIVCYDSLSPNARFDATIVSSMEAVCHDVNSDAEELHLYLSARLSRDGIDTWAIVSSSDSALLMLHERHIHFADNAPTVSFARNFFHTEIRIEDPELPPSVLDFLFCVQHRSQTNFTTPISRMDTKIIERGVACSDLFQEERVRFLSVWVITDEYEVPLSKDPIPFLIVNSLLIESTDKTVLRAHVDNFVNIYVQNLQNSEYPHVKWFCLVDESLFFPAVREGAQFACSIHIDQILVYKNLVLAASIDVHPSFILPVSVATTISIIDIPRVLGVDPFILHLPTLSDNGFPSVTVHLDTDPSKPWKVGNSLKCRYRELGNNEAVWVYSTAFVSSAQNRVRCSVSNQQAMSSAVELIELELYLLDSLGHIVSNRVPIIFLRDPTQFEGIDYGEPCDDASILEALPLSIMIPQSISSLWSFNMLYAEVSHDAIGVHIQDMQSLSCLTSDDSQVICSMTGINLRHQSSWIKLQLNVTDHVSGISNFVDMLPLVFLNNPKTHLHEFPLAISRRADNKISMVFESAPPFNEDFEYQCQFSYSDQDSKKTRVSGIVKSTESGISNLLECTLSIDENTHGIEISLQLEHNSLEYPIKYDKMRLEVVPEIGFQPSTVSIGYATTIVAVDSVNNLKIEVRDGYTLPLLLIDIDSQQVLGPCDALMNQINCTVDLSNYSNLSIDLSIINVAIVPQDWEIGEDSHARIMTIDRPLVLYNETSHVTSILPVVMVQSDPRDSFIIRTERPISLDTCVLSNAEIATFYCTDGSEFVLSAQKLTDDSFKCLGAASIVETDANIDWAIQIVLPHEGPIQIAGTAKMVFQKDFVNITLISGEVHQNSPSTLQIEINDIISPEALPYLACRVGESSTFFPATSVASSSFECTIFTGSSEKQNISLWSTQSYPSGLMIQRLSHDAGFTPSDNEISDLMPFEIEFDLLSPSNEFAMYADELRRTVFIKANQTDSYLRDMFMQTKIFCLVESNSFMQTFVATFDEITDLITCDIGSSESGIHELYLGTVSEEKLSVNSLEMIFVSPDLEMLQPLSVLAAEPQFRIDFNISTLPPISQDIHYMCRIIGGQDIFFDAQEYMGEISCIIQTKCIKRVEQVELVIVARSRTILKLTRRSVIKLNPVRLTTVFPPIVSQTVVRNVSFTVKYLYTDDDLLQPAINASLLLCQFMEQSTRNILWEVTPSEVTQDTITCPELDGRIEWKKDGMVDIRILVAEYRMPYSDNAASFVILHNRLVFQNVERHGTLASLDRLHALREHMTLQAGEDRSLYLPSTEFEVLYTLEAEPTEPNIRLSCQFRSEGSRCLLREVFASISTFPSPLRLLLRVSNDQGQLEMVMETVHLYDGVEIGSIAPWFWYRFTSQLVTIKFSHQPPQSSLNTAEYYFMCHSTAGDHYPLTFLPEGDGGGWEVECTISDKHRNATNPHGIFLAAVPKINSSQYFRFSTNSADIVFIDANQITLPPSITPRFIDDDLTGKLTFTLPPTPTSMTLYDLSMQLIDQNMQIKMANCFFLFSSLTCSLPWSILRHRLPSNDGVISYRVAVTVGDDILLTYLDRFEIFERMRVERIEPSIYVSTRPQPFDLIIRGVGFKETGVTMTYEPMILDSKVPTQTVVCTFVSTTEMRCPAPMFSKPMRLMTHLKFRERTVANAFPDHSYKGMIVYDNDEAKITGVARKGSSLAPSVSVNIFESTSLEIIGERFPFSTTITVILYLDTPNAPVLSVDASYNGRRVAFDIPDDMWLRVYGFQFPLTLSLAISFGGGSRYVTGGHITFRDFNRGELIPAMAPVSKTLPNGLKIPFSFPQHELSKLSLSLVSKDGNHRLELTNCANDLSWCDLTVPLPSVPTDLYLEARRANDENMRKILPSVTPFKVYRDESILISVQPFRILQSERVSLKLVGMNFPTMADGQSIQCAVKYGHADKNGVLSSSFIMYPESCTQLTDQTLIIENPQFNVTGKLSLFVSFNNGFHFTSTSVKLEVIPTFSVRLENAADTSLSHMLAYRESSMNLRFSNAMILKNVADSVSIRMHNLLFDHILSFKSGAHILPDDPSAMRFVSPTLASLTPIASPPSYFALDLSINDGATWISSIPSVFLHSLYELPIIGSISADIVPFSRDTQIIVTGYGFGDTLEEYGMNMTCVLSRNSEMSINNNTTPSILFESNAYPIPQESSIICPIKLDKVEGMGESELLYMYISRNGLFSLLPSPIMFHSEIRLSAVSPVLGPTVGEFDIKISGSFPVMDKPVTCRFSNIAWMKECPKPCNFITPTMIRCTTPATPEGEYTLHLSYNRFDWTAVTSTFKFEGCDPGTGAQDYQELCEPCHPGTTKPTKSQSVCLDCAQGMYMPDNGSKGPCIECPPFTTTIGTGSSNIEDCLCREGYYVSPVYSENTRCRPCPFGASCNAMETIYPVALFGFWNYNTDNATFYVCSPPEACPGGAPERCEIGYRGVRCGVCDFGYYRHNNKCHSCTPFAWTGLAIMLLLIGLIVACLFIFMKIRMSHVVAVSIASQMFQMLSIFKKFDFQFRSEAVDAGLSISGAANFELDFLEVSCLLPLTYEWKWALSLGVPIAFSVAFIILYMGGLLRSAIAGFVQKTFFHRTDADEDLDKPDTDGSNTTTDSIQQHNSLFTKMVSKLRKWMNAVKLWVIWFFTKPLTQRERRHFTYNVVNSFVGFFSFSYMFIVTNASAPFLCTKQPNGQSTLNASPDFLCYESQTWVVMAVIGAIYILVFSIGPLLFFTVTGLQYKRLIRSKAFRLSFRFLFQKYHKRTYFFDMLVTLRKLLISLAMIAFGDMLVIACAIIICFVSLILHLRYLPYKRKNHNLLEYVILLSMTIMLMLGMVYAGGRDLSDWMRATIMVLVFVVAAGGITTVVLLTGWDVITRQRKEKRKARQIAKDSDVTRAQRRKKESEWDDFDDEDDGDDKRTMNDLLESYFDLSRVPRAANSLRKRIVQDVNSVARRLTGRRLNNDTATTTTST